MKIIDKEELKIFFFAVAAFLAGVYFAWQLIGLRYTNHDDIYFHLYSWVFSGDYLSFAKNVAYKQARLQAFINMPIILWVNNLSDSVLFDILNIGSFCVLYLSLIWVLCKIGSVRDSLAIATVTLFLFPLHYYFTFPQGYPVMALWGLAFALISAGLLVSHLKQPKLWKLLLSVFLFTSSLWGPEYNFVLHPTLLLIIFLTQGKINFTYLRKTTWPYATGWAVSVAVYLSFSMISRESGADAYGRVSFGFDFIAWLKTFLILEQKSFLPSALWSGIRFTSATAQGSPEIPALLMFSNLWHGTHDWFSIAVVFVLTFFIFMMIFYWQKLSIKSIRFYSIFFACLAIIPCLVVAGSTHYQIIVLKGYLQGHLVSFYSQLGLSGLVFLLLAYICNANSRNYLKPSVVAFSAIILASFATLTFIYNNVNRQVITANKQKWEAMYELTTFVQSDFQNLKGRVFYAPAFWSTSGVSSIPGDSPFNGVNYWSEYAEKVLNTPLKITNSDGDLSNEALIVKYFSTPVGIPVVILSENLSGKQQWRMILIASRPVAGTMLFQREGNRTRKVAIDQWKCEKQCVNTWNESASIQPLSMDFVPDDHGPARLLAQYMLSRNNEYAHPFGWHSKNEPIGNFNDLKIINWGPQAAALGVVPNSQPDGDAGIWIKFSGGVGLGEVQVIFDNQVAKSTSFTPELITASIPADLFKTPGEKDIYIKQVITGSLLSVGKFNVAAK
jgi:hypothetical protein